MREGRSRVHAASTSSLGPPSQSTTNGWLETTEIYSLTVLKSKLKVLAGPGSKGGDFLALILTSRGGRRALKVLGLRPASLQSLPASSLASPLRVSESPRGPPYSSRPTA